MGYTPAAVDSMSLWEFSSCQAGWQKANGAEEEAAPPSWEEHLDMVRKVKEMDSGARVS